ncbi:MAG: S8/S53 family peptidase [Thermus sp.]|uniref:S8 family peptidase n=1 Tax=Thermus sp. TaxID=275 RepID=UPI0025F5DE21|nr:S8 family serine peptidase [Thermus sp.]MCS7219255.1 S8/S53 family peptidase [Thermus sp.]MDW8018183.1 S8 family serine peptidase [Thermus sp.]
MDIVLGELLVITNDQQKLQSFLSRWGGRVIQSYPYPEVQQVPGLRAYHVRINPSTAQVEAILRELNRQVPELEGSLRTSSQEAAQLLAVALSEARREGMTVMPNLVGQNQAEAPTGEQGYNPNPITWSYMASGTPQNIGVDRAWDELRRVGRLDLPLEERVRIAILDGGFAPNQDFPPGLENFAPLNTRNPATCSGGTPCPWHGTHVLTTAMGVPNNDFGVAGPAGSVARPITIGVRPEVTEIFRIPQILSGLAQARIINMSFSINIPWEVDFAFEMACRASCGPFAPFCHCPSLSGTLSSVSGFLAGAGWLLFASAGNDGRDVDQGGAPFNNEGFTRVPCELAGVICVGGMAENSTRRDPYSAFGSKRDGDSVDIYGPFTVWTGPDPDDNRNRARKQMGTSFSSPFVAGVAALVWAANPALSAGQVWEILRDTAHNCDLGPEVTGHRRCVNAYGAVLRALERSEDFYLHVVTTDPRGSRADLNREWQLLAEVRSMDGRRICEGCPIRLDPPPSRTAGSLRYYRFNTEGRKTITITATDPRNRTHTRRVEVQVVNTPPQVSLLLPNDGDVFATNTDVDFEGRALDLNEGPDPGPGPIECRWRSSNPADPIHNRVGCRHTLRFPSSGNRVITLSATDPQGLTSSKSVRVSVLDFPNQPPAVTMGPLTPEPTYSGGSGVGYASNQRLRATASATDPEGDLPITYTWRVTSYRPDPDPNDGTEPEVWARAVISTRTDTGDLDWIPENTSPRVIGDWRDFPRDCMMGQKVVLQLEVTDSRGNLSRRSLPPFIVYNRSCLLN